MSNSEQLQNRSAVGRVITWCIDNRFLVSLLTLIVILAGVFAIRTTPLDAIPDLSDAQVIIYSKWMGRDPQTIEDQVTYPLTTAMLAVPKVKAVRGYSFFGLSFVYIIFEDGTDMYWARSRVLEYLNQVGEQLPRDVVTTLGPDATGVGWVFQYTLEDKTRQYNLGDLRAVQDWYVRYQLMSVPGVAEVASIGGFNRQYQITVYPHLLQTYNIALGTIIHAVQKSNNDVGGRLLELSETEYMVRGRGYIRSIEDIENIVIKVNRDGTPVLIKDVGQVQMGPDIRRGIAEKNGEGEVVGGIIVMRYGENALDVIENVKAKITEVSAGLPAGMEIHTAYDRSELIKESIGTLRHELIQQMIIVTLVCVLFLWHARSALVAALSLPLGILMSFVVMRFLGVNANIMSLGGIAIAIGAMVDAAVVLIENTHKHLEKSGEASGESRWALIRSAAIEVGPSLFFSLLIITVSFLPVFALQGQAGRLFKPLAFTKTFAMASAAVIAVTITPVLIGFFVRGKIQPESRLAVSRGLIYLYRPVIRWVLNHRVLVIGLAAVVLALTYFPYAKLGSEFMPPLNEGDILYMPTSIPGISETAAKRVLQTQDRLFRTFPEVDVVFGKIGRADTATDPAPLTMVETTVTLKNHDEWPKRWIKYGFIRGKVERVVRELERQGATAEDVDVTSIGGEVEGMVRKSVQARMRVVLARGATQDVADELAKNALREEIPIVLSEYLVSNALVDRSRHAALEDAIKTIMEEKIQIGSVPMRALTIEELMYDDMDKEFRFVGLTNAWTMPIKTRIDMLATGIKTPIGIKIYGDDLETLERLAIDIENVVKAVPGTLSAIAERVMGGNYLDFEIDRREVARHGLTVEDVQDVIETAVGGMNITQTVEGRYRFPVNVRYPRELRDDPVKLGRVLVHAPNGEQVPLGQLANLKIKKGPPGIKSENALLQSIVYVDLQKGQDIGGYVGRAQKAVEDAIALPPGYYISWSGQYEHMIEVNRRLRIVVPITLLIIFLLLYFNFGRITETLIVMLSLPFAVVGGIWYMYLLDYNLSVAAGVGFIALAGLAAELGVVMLLFLNIAYNEELSRGGAMTLRRLYDAIIAGTVMRLRPLLMTVTTTIMGLLPIMWITGVGSRPMQRMAAPMIGGLISATILTLIVIPAIYAIIKTRKDRIKATVEDETASKEIR
jgi:Cu(I)/Ag(I) efflux system membrane protein CusA/SilA